MNLSTEARSSLFDLVIHAAWADGRLCVEELSAARAAARALHLEGEEGARGRLRLGPDTSLPSIARTLTYRESAIGFAVLVWVVSADRVEHSRETALLDEWRLLTGVRRDVAAVMRAVVRRARSTHRASVDDQLRALIAEAHDALSTSASGPPARRARVAHRRAPGLRGPVAGSAELRTVGAPREDAATHDDLARLAR